MATVTLPFPDIGLFADFEATRVVLPRMSAQPLQQTRDQALVRFEGDDDPTAFRGDGRSRVFALVVRYGQDEHDEMADLLALFDAAQDAADGRLMLRLNAYTDPRLNPLEVVTVAADASSSAGSHSRAWDVSFTATRVAHTIEV